MTLVSVAMDTFDNKHVIMTQVLEHCQWHLKLQKFTDLLEYQPETFLDFLTRAVKTKTLRICIIFTGVQMTVGQIFEKTVNGK